MNSMVTMNEFRRGMCLKISGKLLRIVEFQHVNPGNWRSFTRTKMKDLSSGKIFEESFRENEQFEEARIDGAEMQLLYSDVNGYHFMNQETFDQVTLSKDDLGDAVKYLKDNDIIKVDFYNSKPIGIDLPASVTLKVTETEPGVKGNTAQGATKLAKLETGLVVNVPLFINEGENLKVDTRTGEFLSRA